MNVSRILNTYSNKAKLAILPKKNSKEVAELCDDLIQNSPYKNIKIKLNGRDNVSVIASESKSNNMTINMDFAKNAQTQIEHRTGYVFTILPPHKEFTQEIRGNIGGPVKIAKTTNISKNDDGSKFIKTQDYENFISGNHFRREETPDGVKFYRNIDGDFVEMFKK